MADDVTTDATKVDTDAAQVQADVVVDTKVATFQETLSEDNRGHELIKGFESGDAMAQALIDVQGKIPVIPDKYELGDQLKGTGFNKAYAEMAKESGLTQEQANKGYAMFAGLEQAGVDAQKAIVDKMATDVKEMWKGAEYEKNIALADEAALKMGGDDFVKVLKDSGLNRHPTILKTLHAVGQATSEDSLVQGNKAAVTKNVNEFGEKVLDFSKSMGK